MTGGFMFGLLGSRRRTEPASTARPSDQLAATGSTSRELPHARMSSTTFNRASTAHRETQRALSSSGSLSNGSGSTIPAGCCAFLISGLTQGVAFISQIKEQEYPEAVTSRKVTLMWLHACASVGYGLGRMTGGPPRSLCFKPSTLSHPANYYPPRPDPVGISFVSLELQNLFMDAVKKRGEDASVAPAIGLLPHVIVVMPIFAKSQSSLERLEQALEVLSSQTHIPIAVILIDDCSPVNLVEHFQGSTSPQFALRKRSSGKEGITLSGTWRASLQVLVLRLDANHGPAFARNVGLKAAASAFPPPSNPPSASNSDFGSSGPPNPRSPLLPAHMIVVCLLDLGCIPSSNQWTFHHASAQASIGGNGGSHGVALDMEMCKNSAASKSSSKSNSRTGVGREGGAGQLGGIVVGRAMASKALHSVGIYHDLFGTLNCRKLEDGQLLYGTSCNMSLPLHLFQADPEPVVLDMEAAGSSRLPQQRPGGLVRFNESFPAPAFEDVQLCLDARALGVPMVEDASNEASVVHDYAYSSYGLFAQYLRYGQHEWRVLQGHQAYLTELGASYITSNY